MWLLFAVGSAFFAGVTSILVKCGIRKTDSTVATAVRTIVILVFSWIMVFVAGSQDQITEISGRTLLFLILSGAATGASWLCYFKALQIGDINKVVPIDKSSTVLTILLALIFLGEGVSLPKAVAVVVIAAGIFLMIEKKRGLGSGYINIGARYADTSTRCRLSQYAHIRMFEFQLAGQFDGTAGSEQYRTGRIITRMQSPAERSLHQIVVRTVIQSGYKIHFTSALVYCTAAGGKLPPTFCTWKSRHFCRLTQST